MEELKQALTDIQTTESSLIRYLNDVLNEPDGVSQLMDGRIGRLFELAKCYKSAFDRLKVKSRAEFQEHIKRGYRYAEIRDLDEDIVNLEGEWDGILQRIDQSLKEDDTGVELGDTGPEQISDSGGRAIVVSFGDQKGAQQWLVETSCPFPMLLDSQRKVYTAFGLHRSVSKVWGVEEMVYYAESMAKNIPLPNPSQYVNDDPQQMGGDFIIDKDGVVQYMYCSKKSIDRPSVQDILDNLKKLQ